MVKKTGMMVSRYPGTKREEQALIPLPRSSDRLAIPALWLWFTLIIVVGLVVLGVVSSIVNYWLDSTSFVNRGTAFPAAKTMPVNRGAFYTGLEILILDAQYASAVQEMPGPAFVRLNVRIINRLAHPMLIVYEKTARLLIPGVVPVAPTRVYLSRSLELGISEMGWLDFPVPTNTSLEALTLQLGATATSARPVMIRLKN